MTGRVVDGVAYFRIESFQPGTAQLLRASLAGLKASATAPLHGVILDLCDNAGGLLNDAVETVGELLPANLVFASVTGRDPTGNQRLIASGDMTDGVPMVILVNGGTAAGSEMAAAALQAGRGAVLMGSRTAGAGTVQTVFPVPSLGAAVITTGAFTLPSGHVLGPPGLLPQVALVGGRDGAGEEAPSRDPLILRLRPAVPRGPEAAPFDNANAPQLDPEVTQASAALAIMQQVRAAHP